MDRPLSTLELTILGIVMRLGPCLAHAVVKQFSDSNEYAYHSGAGSVYPLLNRLAAAGFLEQEGRKFGLTVAGRSALRQWLLPSTGSQALSTNLDVLRLRTQFLGLLEPFERIEFVRASLSLLEELLAICRLNLEAHRRSGDPFGEFAALGAVMETEARIAWMREMRWRLKALRA